MITKLKADLKKAMQEKDKDLKETIQLVLAKGQNYAKAELAEINDNHVIKSLKVELQQMKDSVEQMKEKFTNEQLEVFARKIQYVESMLPKMVSLEEIEKVVKEELDKLQEVSMKQMGGVIKAVKAMFGETVDGKVVSDVVKSEIEKRSK